MTIGAVKQKDIVRGYVMKGERENVLSSVYRSPTIGFILFTLLFSVFVYRPVNDPDFGWHLAAGKYYVETRSIPATDIFSSTMPEYPWVNHEYLIDAIHYKLYALAGETTVLLSIFYIALAFLIFVFLLPRLFSPPPALPGLYAIASLTFILMNSFWGVRSQIIDWATFLAFLLLWKRFEDTNRPVFLYGMIPLFLAWANLHGGFFIGSAVFAFFIASRILSGILAGQRSLSRTFLQNPAVLPQDKIRQSFPLDSISRGKVRGLFLAFFLSAAVTFINPYGARLHGELFATLRDTVARQFIVEWLPAVITNASFLPFFGYLLFFLFQFLVSGKRTARTCEARPEAAVRPQDVFLLILLLAAALSSARMIPFFIFFSLPILWRHFSEKDLFLPVLSSVILVCFLGSVFLRQGAPDFFVSPPKNRDGYTSLRPNPRSFPPWRQDVFWDETPQNAFSYLAHHMPEGNMFNDYGWGGGIIWAYPGVKTFIDGRMSYWKIGDKKIFEDYLTIERLQKGWREKMDEYGIQWILIQSDSPLASALEVLPDQWKEMYRDNQAVIFVKKQTSP